MKLTDERRSRRYRRAAMRLIEKSLLMLGEFFDFIIVTCALLLALTAAALAFA